VAEGTKKARTPYQFSDAQKVHVTQSEAAHRAAFVMSRCARRTTEFAFLLKGVQINTAPLPRRPVSSSSCLATPLFRLDPALEVLGTVDDSCLVGCPFVIVSKGLWACSGARCELTRGTRKIQISGLHKRAKRMPIPQRNAGVAAMFHQVGDP